MGDSTLSGPLRVGPNKETGGSKVKNTGLVVLSQTAAWAQSTTGTSTGIVIPAGSQIIEVQMSINTAPTAANLSVGTSVTANELFSALALGTSADVFLFGTAATITDMDAWADVGSTDVTIWTISSAGSAGAGWITVKYIQGTDLA